MNNISNFHKKQMDVITGSIFNHYFEEDNYDAQQPDHPFVPESDAEIMEEEARREQAYEHSLS